MSISTPVVNSGLKYLNGLVMTYVSATSLSVSAGRCRDQFNITDIVLGYQPNVAASDTGEEPVPPYTAGVPTVVLTNVVGAGGIDQGAIADSTFYAVYAIGDSYNNNPGSAIISTNFAAPVYPMGYNTSFRIGYIKTDSSGNILAFRQDGAGLARWMWYDVAIATSVTAGASATFAAVNCSAGIPNAANVSTMANFLCLFTPTAAGNGLQLKPGASAATSGYARASGSVAAVVETVNMICPVDPSATVSIEYVVVGSAVAIDVAAYLDILA